MPVAHIGGLVASALARLAKIRYLFLMGTAAGGASAYQTYESWKAKLPDFSWTKEYVPSWEQIEDYKQSMIEYSKSINLPEFPDFSEYVPREFPRLAAAREWFNEKIAAKPIPDETGSSLNAKNQQSLREDQSVMLAAFQKQQEYLKTEELQNQILSQQSHFQSEIERLKKENRELRKSLILKLEKPVKKRRIKRSLIDMYSEVLDELAEFNKGFSGLTFEKGYSAQDQLPRVIVVGDQSAGKTSVLEMIVQARIFPRGSGEMMTRSPVKVTLSEGPYHVAKFKDSNKEYDLTKESELEALRKEIELRMKLSVGDGQTVSNETISLTVKGPGLHRIVLVDLPGIISTVTTGMASDTRTKIREMCKNHMENPNAIILCIQDGSLDAERSNVTDLVSSMDPSGKRTIFVLTKVDVAENNKYSPDRIKKILEGKLFPMKALGYFAVVTGKGNSEDSIRDIKKYEADFFKSSKLLKDGVLWPHQLTTDNLSVAVSKCFWKMVRESIDQQADAFKATRFNLETEWRNTFPKSRELIREELFKEARSEILDQVINLSQIPAQHWEAIFKRNLWTKFSDDLFNNIYLPASSAECPGAFNTTIDIKLRNWAEKTLPHLCVQIGQSTIQSEFQKLLLSDVGSDPVLDGLKIEVSKHQHQWDSKAEESLRVIQHSTLSDTNMEEKAQWDSAIKFMETVVKEKLSQAEENFSKLLGPGRREMWTNWKSRTPEQINRRQTVRELEKLIHGKKSQGLLGRDELTAVRKNLETQSVIVDDDFIQETWQHLHKLASLKKTLSLTNECRKGFYYYRKGYTEDEVTCDDVLFFWRIERMLDVTSSALRQHVINNEVRRFEQGIKGVLNDIGDDGSKLETLLSGKRVDLAEKLKRVRQIQELLEEFIHALNKERP